MKRPFVKLISRNFVPALIITATLFAVTPLQSLAGNTTIEIISNENKSSVKFTGSTDSALFFDVKINNPNADKFTLLVQTEDKETLFKKEYTDTSFSKKLQLLKSEYVGNYTITIRSSNKELQNTYYVNTVTKTVDDVIVTKL